MEQLINIYNALLKISTKGEDTILMSNCIMALGEYIKNENNKNAEVSTEE